MPIKKSRIAEMADNLYNRFDRTGNKSMDISALTATLYTFLTQRHTEKEFKQRWERSFEQYNHDFNNRLAKLQTTLKTKGAEPEWGVWFEVQPRLKKMSLTMNVK